MQIMITFHNMPHSSEIEAHINRRLKKIQDLLHDEEKPQLADVHLTASHVHAHHTAEFNLKTKSFNIHAKFEMPDMYEAFDKTFESILAQLKKDKEKQRDSHRKGDSEKKNFIK